MAEPKDDENATYNKGMDGQPVSLEAQPEESGRRFSPSVGRNSDVVREAFLSQMPQTGAIIEIGSGTGEHGVHITAKAPGLRWTFTDADRASLRSAQAWIDHARRGDFDRAVFLDASEPLWGGQIEGQSFAGLFCANVIHISPLAVAQGLFAGAGRVLSEEGRIFLYGPFARAGQMSEGNLRFDADLKRRNRDWSVRDLEDEIIPMAAACGFRLHACVEMPKNNLSVVFVRSGTG